MEFSRPEYWSGQPFPSPGDLPDPGIELGSPALQADSLPTEPPGKPDLLSRTPQICVHLLGEVKGTTRLGEARACGVPWSQGGDSLPSRALWCCSSLPRHPRLRPGLGPGSPHSSLALAATALWEDRSCEGHASRPGQQHAVQLRTGLSLQVWGGP